MKHHFLIRSHEGYKTIHLIDSGLTIGGIVRIHRKFFLSFTGPTGLHFVKELDSLKSCCDHINIQYGYLK